MLPIQIGGLVFTVSHRKRIVTGVTDRGVRVRYVMKWHSLYQSVSHSVTAVVPECCLPLSPASSSHGPWLCLWENSHSSPSSCLYRSPSLLHQAFISTFYKLTLFSLLFPHLQLWLAEKRGGGKHAKRCGICFIVLGIHGDPSQGTLPFSFTLFLFFQLSFLKASFFYLFMKSHSSLPTNLFLFFLPVCFFSPLECLAEEVVEPV